MAVLLEHPEILDLIRFRCAAMTRVYGDIRGAMRRERPKIDFRENGPNGGEAPLPASTSRGGGLRTQKPKRTSFFADATATVDLAR